MLRPVTADPGIFLFWDLHSGSEALTQISAAAVKRYSDWHLLTWLSSSFYCCLSSPLGSTCLNGLPGVNYCLRYPEFGIAFELYVCISWMPLYIAIQFSWLLTQVLSWAHSWWSFLCGCEWPMAPIPRTDHRSSSGSALWHSLYREEFRVSHKFVIFLGIPFRSYTEK